MDNELVISATSEEEVRIALLGDDRLIELHKENPESNEFSVGDVYLGKVRKLAVGLNAAFVHVGHEKDGFLHYFDLGPQFLTHNNYTKRCIEGKQNTAALAAFRREKDIDKNGKVDDVLKQGYDILVQVSKEPISTKGPRLTTEITLAGRYLVLVPFSDRISMSKNIRKNGEKERLKRLLESIVPKGFGVIVRTVAEDKKVAQLDADLKELVKRWRKIHKNLHDAKPAKRVLGELNRSSAILRDVMSESFSSIKVDNAEMAEELKDYIKIISPDKENIVKFYKGKAPLFESAGIEKQIKQSFGRHVTMKSGAYLVIEHTEALHVVDVNSGNTAKSKDNQETNALRVNLESAEEMGRQMRLRDMGGIIVIDFIDLQKAENRKLLHNKMREAMAGDKAKHQVLAPSKFGLVQITRQRVRPQMTIKTSEVCPSCKGTGEVQASVLIIEEMERSMTAIMEKYPDESISLEVHPFLEAYLKKGYPSVNMKWLVKFKKRYKIKAATSSTFLEYHFYDHDRNELKL